MTASPRLQYRERLALAHIAVCRTSLPVSWRRTEDEGGPGIGQASRPDRWHGASQGQPRQSIVYAAAIVRVHAWRRCRTDATSESAGRPALSWQALSLAASLLPPAPRQPPRQPAAKPAEAAKPTAAAAKPHRSRAAPAQPPPSRPRPRSRGASRAAPPPPSLATAEDRSEPDRQAGGADRRHRPAPSGRRRSRKRRCWPSWSRPASCRRSSSACRKIRSSSSRSTRSGSTAAPGDAASPARPTSGTATAPRRPRQPAVLGLHRREGRAEHRQGLQDRGRRQDACPLAAPGHEMV